MIQLRWLMLASMAILPANASAENWPQWRGPNNDGVSTAKGLPTTWSETTNTIWKLPLPGMGCSTPCIWGDRIFLTTESAAELVALCIDKTGKIEWEETLGKSTNKARGDEGNGATASPSTDGKHVWFFVGSGELACFTIEGKEVWKFNLQDKYGKFKIQFGMHSTPVLHDGKLYLQMFHDGGQHVVALRAIDGKEIWHVERPSDGRAECLHSYASPFIWTNGKEAYLVIHGNDYTTGHQLTDGKEIWRLGGLNPKDKYNPTLRFVASPVCTPDLIVVPTAKGGPVVAVKPTAMGKFGPDGDYELWRKNRDTPDVPSPLVHDGIVYMARENGMFYTLDAKTGAEIYAAQRLHNDRHRASPVYADGKVYVASRDGTVSVVKAGKSFELLAKNKLADDTAASLAISDGRIYLRGFKHLYAIGSK